MKYELFSFQEHLVQSHGGEKTKGCPRLCGGSAPGRQARLVAPGLPGVGMAPSLLQDLLSDPKS